MNKFNSVKIASLVFDAAIDGIQKLRDSLGGDFNQLVDSISNINGKVVVSGMGKSGHVARKIAATLASTGTPAFFVHLGEASHGDLGMIARDDLLILLSNSGETRELHDIINYAKRFSIKIASFVGKAKSSLAVASDFALILPPIQEALGSAAPTTSTTMMLTLGDALAIALSEKKGFDREAFQVFHPGGRLGASFVKVSQIMHGRDKIPCILPDTKFDEVIQKMTDYKLGCAIVIDKEWNLYGIITDGNLRRHLAPQIFSMSAGNLATKNPLTINENKFALEALDIMNQRAVTSLIVEDNHKKIVGLVHIHDCLRIGAMPNVNAK